MYNHCFLTLPVGIARMPIRASSTCFGGSNSAIPLVFWIMLLKLYRMLLELGEAAGLLVGAAFGRIVEGLYLFLFLLQTLGSHSEQILGNLNGLRDRYCGLDSSRNGRIHFFKSVLCPLNSLLSTDDCACLLLSQRLFQNFGSL